MQLHRVVFLSAVVFFLAPITVHVAAQAPREDISRPQADLAWFMTGLRDLCRTKDGALKLTSAQAKKILPELEALIEEKILRIEVQESDEQRQGSFQGQQPGRGGGLSDEGIAKMTEQSRKIAERIDKAIESMEDALQVKQVDYILNLEFDAAAYGLAMRSGLRSSPSGQPGSFDRAQMEKLRQAMEEAQKKLIQLNKETVDLVRKLAK